MIAARSSQRRFSAARNRAAREVLPRAPRSAPYQASLVTSPTRSRRRAASARPRPERPPRSRSPRRAARRSVEQLQSLGRRLKSPALRASLASQPKRPGERDVLAERHQMALVVALDAARRDQPTELKYSRLPREAPVGVLTSTAQPRVASASTSRREARVVRPARTARRRSRARGAAPPAGRPRPRVRSVAGSRPRPARRRSGPRRRVRLHDRRLAHGNLGTLAPSPLGHAAQPRADREQRRRDQQAERRRLPAPTTAPAREPEPRHERQVRDPPGADPGRDRQRARDRQPGSRRRGSRGSR